MSPTRPPRQNRSTPRTTPASTAARLPTVGEPFDKYTLLAKLATGGMAELFVARLKGASGFRKNVVIKRILPHVAHDEHFTRMFLDEAITCAQISHPNVCQVFELCETEQSHFLVLEHLEGATVGDLIRRCLVAGQQVNLALAAGIIVQACDGLHAAHEQTDENDNNVGLVHRDVSPGNLFVTVDGIVKVLDFGIAKAAWMSRKTRTGTLLGKCEYMSPEQARGVAPVDRRSDVFSLGIIAWEMLCGRRLFRRESEYETLRAVLRDPIERPRDIRPTVPVELDEVIMRALERDPDDRYRTANAFRHAIAEALKDRGGPTPMCDIAPLIRSSFAEELKLQRAVLKKATVLSNKNVLPSLRSMPRGTEPPVIDENTTDVRTQPVQPLPSVESGPVEDDPESKELTFRVIPKTPPRGHVAVEGNTAPKVEAAPEVVRVPGPRRPSGPIPSSAPQVNHDPIKSKSEPIARESGSASISFEPVQQRHHVGLMLAVAILGAGLAATMTFLYYGRGGGLANAPKAAAVPTPALLAAESSEAKSDAAPKATGSAKENKEEKDRILAANAARPVVVTSLDSDSTGSLSIRSSQPATIYLYPDKTILGTTPLLDIKLPVGQHKLKAQIGLGKGKRKYFHVKVEAGKAQERVFEHWSKSKPAARKAKPLEAAPEATPEEAPEAAPAAPPEASASPGQTP